MDPNDDPPITPYKVMLMDPNDDPPITAYRTLDPLDLLDELPDELITHDGPSDDLQDNYTVTDMDIEEITNTMILDTIPGSIDLDNSLDEVITELPNLNISVYDDGWIDVFDSSFLDIDKPECTLMINPELETNSEPNSPIAEPSIKEDVLNTPNFEATENAAIAEVPARTEDKYSNIRKFAFKRLANVNLERLSHNEILDLVIRICLEIKMRYGNGEFQDINPNNNFSRNHFTSDHLSPFISPPDSDDDLQNISRNQILDISHLQNKMEEDMNNKFENIKDSSCNISILSNLTINKNDVVEKNQPANSKNSIEEEYSSEQFYDSMVSQVEDSIKKDQEGPISQDLKTLINIQSQKSPISNWDEFDPPIDLKQKVTNADDNCSIKSSSSVASPVMENILDFKQHFDRVKDHARNQWVFSINVGKFDLDVDKPYRELLKRLKQKSQVGKKRIRVSEKLQKRKIRNSIRVDFNGADPNDPKLFQLIPTVMITKLILNRNIPRSCIKRIIRRETLCMRYNTSSNTHISTIPGGSQNVITGDEPSTSGIGRDTKNRTCKKTWNYKGN